MSTVATVQKQYKIEQKLFGFMETTPSYTSSNGIVYKPCNLISKENTEKWNTGFDMIKNLPHNKPYVYKKELVMFIDTEAKIFGMRHKNDKEGRFYSLVEL